MEYEKSLDYVSYKAHIDEAVSCIKQAAKLAPYKTPLLGLTVVLNDIADRMYIFKEELKQQGREDKKLLW